MNHTSDHACRVHVLAVSPFESDHTSLSHIFGHTAWEFDTARTLQQASEKLLDSVSLVSPLVLCDEVLPDGTWKDMLRIIQQQPDPNYLIVTSQRADDRLWAEVLNLGAYDVLAKPFHSAEVFRTIGLAWRQCMEARKSVGRAASRRAMAGAVA
jgi:DNA-binding response OmpR family regulator